MDEYGVIMSGQKGSLQKKMVPSATLSITNPIRNDLGTNPVSEMRNRLVTT